jgi:undecaprenyl-phosphate 4-deoxy-4-formamido-L-arabinose transferase
MLQETPEISAVIPVYNEADCLNELLKRLVTSMDSLGRTYEIVIVDDGSTDDSVAILQAFQAAEPRLRIVRLRRNFGQTPALYAGFSAVRGQIIVTLDADLQNPPEEIAKIIDKLEEGYDVVQGWREQRQDSIFRRFCSKILNRIVSYLAGIHIKDLGCGLKAYRRDVIDQMAHFSHRARYVPAEVVWLGAKIGEVKVEHCERAAGKSKYGLLSLLQLNFNMITSISAMPIKTIGMIGWMFSFMGMFMGTLVGIKRIRYGILDPNITVVALFFFLAGVQLVATGFMCEYIGRIFVEVQRKPYYIIRDILEKDGQNQ